MSARDESRRLSGNQLVVIVVAICAAVVLAPVGVYAAATQKVKVVGTVPVTGAVKSTIQGTVPVSGAVDVAGTVAVAGTVPTQQVRHPGSFTKTISSDQSAASLFDVADAYYLTSISVSNPSGAQTYSWIYDYSDAECLSFAGYSAYVVTPANDTVQLTFPDPVLLTKKCALVHASGVMTLTGYRE